MNKRAFGLASEGDKSASIFYKQALANSIKQKTIHGASEQITFSAKSGECVSDSVDPCLQCFKHVFVLLPQENDVVFERTHQGIGDEFVGLQSKGSYSLYNFLCKLFQSKGSCFPIFLCK